MSLVRPTGPSGSLHEAVRLAQGGKRGGVAVVTDTDRDEWRRLAEARIRTLEAENAALRKAIIDYRAGIMLLNPALSAVLVAHLPEPQGGDSDY